MTRRVAKMVDKKMIVKENNNKKSNFKYNIICNNNGESLESVIERAFKRYIWSKKIT